MARRDRGHPGERGAVGRALAALVVLVLAAGGYGYQQGLLADWADAVLDREPAGPAAVPPPEGLELPALASPSPVATPVDHRASAPRPGKVRRALAPHLADPALGRHVLAAVAGLDGRPVWQHGRGTAIPASTTKVLTAVAALSALGPERRFETTVVSGGGSRIVLVGGGDPLLMREPADPADPPYPARADVTTLAARTAARLRQRGTTRVRLGYDDSLFTGPAASPGWRPDYLRHEVVAPITALWVDEGRPADGCCRVADPSLEAAQAFAAALERHGIRVAGQPRRGVAGATGQRLAAVSGAPVRQIVERVLEVSDNEASEVLAHHVGLTRRGEASFAAGAVATRDVLAELGVPTGGLVLHDGSGLSRRNRIAPATLLGALARALDPSRPTLHSVGAALPVAAFTGSLTYRFDEAAPTSRGRVRAKTGTLTAVSSLAGVATGLDGTPMLFVLMADRIRKPMEGRAEDAIDSAAGALGACRCGGGSQAAG